MEAVMATAYPQTWERTLLPLAYEAEHRVATLTPRPVSDTASLDRAYAYCEAITSTQPDLLRGDWTAASRETARHARALRLLPLER
jgi:hypothetical protein